MKEYIISLQNTFLAPRPAIAGSIILYLRRQCRKHCTAETAEKRKNVATLVFG